MYSIIAIVILSTLNPMQSDSPHAEFIGFSGDERVAAWTNDGQTIEVIKTDTGRPMKVFAIRSRRGSRAWRRFAKRHAFSAVALSAKASPITMFTLSTTRFPLVDGTWLHLRGTEQYRSLSGYYVANFEGGAFTVRRLRERLRDALQRSSDPRVDRVVARIFRERTQRGKNTSPQW